MSESRKRVRLILFGCLLLAILSGLLGWVLHGSPRQIAEVTLVKAEETSDRLKLEVLVNMRNNTAWRTLNHDQDGVRENGYGSSTESPDFIFDRLFRPFPSKGATVFDFLKEDGEEVKVHLPLNEVRRVTSGEELSLISSSRAGTQVRAVSIRIESVE